MPARGSDDDLEVDLTLLSRCRANHKRPKSVSDNAQRPSLRLLTYSPSHPDPVLIRIPSSLIDDHRDPILPIRLLQVRANLSCPARARALLVEA